MRNDRHEPLATESELAAQHAVVAYIQGVVLVLIAATLALLGWFLNHFAQAIIRHGIQMVFDQFLFWSAVGVILILVALALLMHSVWAANVAKLGQIRR